MKVTINKGQSLNNRNVISYKTKIYSAYAAYCCIMKLLFIFNTRLVSLGSVGGIFYHK